MIKEINNFLLDKECDYLIKVHNEYYDKFGKNHNETEVLSLLNPLSNDATETFIDNKIIVPSKGKIVTFQGSKALHGVNEILKGNRYTVPVWYMSSTIV
jgi:hypothetical protein